MPKIFGFLLLFCAYVLIIPGLTKPMLTVAGTVEKAKLVDVGKDILKSSREIPRLVKEMINPILRKVDARGTVPAFKKSNSILGTAAELHKNNHTPVAALILVFSVGIPMLKALLMIAAHLPFRVAVQRKLLWVSSVTSKWSMADVFVVAIFVAYMAASGMKERRALVEFSSDLGPGFYYFLSYCLLSILATQLITGSITWKDDTEKVDTGKDRTQKDKTSKGGALKNKILGKKALQKNAQKN